MTIKTETIAALAAAFGTQAIARTKDSGARELARRIVAESSAQKLRDAMSSAEARETYSPAEESRIETLRKVLWPQARALSVRIARLDAMSRDRELPIRDREDATITAFRLSALLARFNETRVRRVGAFPISRGDMRSDTSRFLVSAKWRRFMFAGGRDAISRLFDDSDILQGAFVRAIEAGDTVSGIPAYGTLFRHVQAERAHLTAITRAEWRGTMAALHGEREREAAYPAEDDKHVMRRLGTRHANGKNYGTLETHRITIALAHREAQWRDAADAVTHEARQTSVLAVSASSFPRILAEAIMGGATLAEIADALGLNVGTIRDRALAERESVMSSGIDHMEDMAPDDIVQERKAEKAQADHAESLRSRYALARRADYMRNHGAIRATILPGKSVAV